MWRKQSEFQEAHGSGDDRDPGAAADATPKHLGPHAPAAASEPPAPVTSAPDPAPTAYLPLPEMRPLRPCASRSSSS